MLTVRRVRSIAIATGLFVSACIGGTTAPRQLGLVAAGRAADAADTPVKGANVSVQVLWPGRTGSRFGCTGSYLIGQWGILTADDGEFGLDMRLNPPTTQVCVVVFGARRVIPRGATLPPSSPT